MKTLFLLALGFVLGVYVNTKYMDWDLNKAAHDSNKRIIEICEKIENKIKENK